jgi:hypothetical protein
VFAFQAFLATAVATQMAATASTDAFAICHTIPEGTGAPGTSSAQNRRALGRRPDVAGVRQYLAQRRSANL